ncbi:Rad52/Rad22 family DNA repair protein [Paenibacillus polysaccharolyticus]|uniref:Rad52/Rad22 family DNA repair protein n=1 Tax=Paenibacillus polysaccharolyticus TaxID=582692 RepID=UPI00209FB99C|nr:Rad52/Rad22 family DNA repair protein [Paenibacillus polysaccharolyticus]MCP1134371.1 Rad52/Rad22 family DNA repair protein [Paenibacillus polysaccharolyticus]
MDAQEVMKRLQEPFPPEEIEWRVGSTNGDKTKGIALAYVTNRAIQNRLDEVFGVFGWRNEYREWKEKSQLCGISVKVEGEWITKWDGADDSNMEAVKGGLSDAMKRAAYQWGIGRYLYKLENMWVPIKAAGRSHVLVSEPQLPQWALPEGFRYNGKRQAVDPPPQEESKTETTQKKNTDNNQENTTTSLMISVAQIKYSHRIKNDKHISDDDFKMMVSQVGNGKESIKDLTKKEASILINQLNEYPAGA